MKILKSFAFLFLIFCTITGFAQDTLISYFDSDWVEVAEGDRSAEFRRKGFKTASGWGVIDNYLSNGVIQMTGTFKTAKAKTRIGDFAYYYEDGQLKNGGNYIKGKREGEWNWYYENGQKMLNVPMYHKGKSTSIETRWLEDGSLDYKCSYKKDKLNGESKWYHENGKVSSVEQHSNGKLVSYKFYSRRGAEETGSDYFVRASYPKGDYGLQKAISSEIEYPARALKNDIQGVVIILFIVNKEGAVEDSEVIGSVNDYLDDEAIRVVETLDKWEPAKQHNREIKMRFRIPVRFEIN
jgi:TonB family protein